MVCLTLRHWDFCQTQLNTTEAVFLRAQVMYSIPLGALMQNQGSKFRFIILNLLFFSLLFERTLQASAKPLDAIASVQQVNAQHNLQIQSEIDNLIEGTEPEKDISKVVKAYMPYATIYLNSQQFFSENQSITCHKFQRIDKLINININLAADRVRAFRSSFDFQMAYLHQVRIEILAQLSLLVLQTVQSDAEGGISKIPGKRPVYLTCVTGMKRTELKRAMLQRHAALIHYRDILFGQVSLKNETAISDKLAEYQNGLSNRLWLGDRLWEGLEAYTLLGKIQTYWKVGLVAWFFLRRNDDVMKSRGVTNPVLSGTSTDMLMGQFVFSSPRSPFFKDLDYQNYLDSIETFISASPNIETYLYIIRLIEETNKSVINEKMTSLQKRLITKHTLKKGKERTANLVTKKLKEQ